MNKEHSSSGQQSSTYPSATAIVSEDQQSRALVSNVADFYSNPYVYMPDPNNLVPAAQTLPANFFQPTAYFQAGTPTLDFLWTPWTFDMIHGNDLNSPLVDYHTHQFPGAANSSGHLHNRLPPLQSGFAVPTEFPLTGLMTRSGNSNVYGTRSQSGRKGGRRPREIEDKDQYDLTQEDKEKRQKRRERNKQAAARCRKRRMDLMESLQKQVDELRNENDKKQMIIEQLNQQSRELMGLLSSHNCQHHSKILPQQVRHLQQQQTNKDQSLLYNGCDMMSQQQQNQLHLKMEPDNDQRLPSDMDSLFKDDQMVSDRSSPINDSYPITTCSMITNNDPVISHATFQPTSIKRSKLNESPLISESNESPAFSRPTTLPLTTPQYSNELGNNLPSLNTPSAGLNIYSGSEFSLLNQQTFLTPMTLGPIPVTSNANTPPHGDLRQL